MNRMVNTRINAKWPSRLFFISLFVATTSSQAATNPQANPTTSDTAVMLSSEHTDALHDWHVETDGNNLLQVEPLLSSHGQGLKLDYEMLSVRNPGWVSIYTRFEQPLDLSRPLVMDLKADSASTLEIKFIDSDGSVFIKWLPLDQQYQEWTNLVIYEDSLLYGWGGKDDKLDNIAMIELAISGRHDSGTVMLSQLHIGSDNLTATFPSAGPQLDPNRHLEGVGFEQRRAEKMRPKDPLVLEYLKQVQDEYSQEQQLLVSQEGLGNEFHTFNNALAAMAFIVEGEQERAERILDFFAEATDKDNTDPRRQNFFLNGEARGFYQSVNIREHDGVEPYTTAQSDRWMGDMSWLLMAYLHHQKVYGSDKYDEITGLLKTLLISWYIDDESSGGGYIQHGWRRGDAKLHEDSGHPEGNIDAYAVMKLLGEDEYAENIKRWLDEAIKGNNQPLDLYTWRVLAYGQSSANLLDIPEHDLRYRKTLIHEGKKVSGFYHGADSDATNIWLDGTGHTACAYLMYGDKQRGYFYANQLDKLMIDRDINGVHTRGIPYTVNKDNGYDWVEPDRGFTSVAAWYLFAKNGFNPMTLETVDIEFEDSSSK